MGPMVSHGDQTSPIPPTTTTTTTTTLPSKKFTSELLLKVMDGKSPASILPYWYGYAWNPAKSIVQPVADKWTEAIYKEIMESAPALTDEGPKDIKRICPNYLKMSKDARALFWVKMISTLASFESGFRAGATFDDTQNVISNDGDKDEVSQIISTGLLQISHLSSQQDQYRCDMISANPVQGNKDLKDPIRNLQCGVRIFNHWIETDRVIAFSPKNNEEGRPIWRGIARYWGPFRHPTLADSANDYWEILSNRFERWVDESKKRDAYLFTEFKEKKANGESWKISDWEARQSSTPHPSFLEDKYKNEESHRFTTMVRIMTQTAPCYEGL